MPAAFTPSPSSATDTCATRLSRLVVKNGVSLGLLADDDRALALAWVWAGLDAAAVMNERDINAALKAQLAGPAAWLDTDHVELRRWLVDGGWLQRDGWGREYRRVADLPEHRRGVAAAVQQVLAGADTTAWTAAKRQAHVAEREARRQRWQPSGPA